MSRHDNVNPPFLIGASMESTADEIRLEIDLRLKLEEIVESQAELLMAQARRQHPTRQQLCTLASSIYDARRTRDRIFDSKLFGEPAWDMLLALYCLPARGEMLRASALGFAANVPPTTGLRWEGVLLNEGLIERGPQELPLRKQFFKLTEKGRLLLERYLVRLFNCTVSIPQFPERAGG
jgi:DNA-binding MarR family transcriptional regulator